MSHDQPKSPQFNRLHKLSGAELQRQPQAPPETSVEGIDELVHDLRTHQIELEVQNEELRCSQKELVVSRDDYTELYDFAPVGYVTVSDRGLILRANLTIADLLGKERRSVVNHRFSAFIVGDDQNAFYTFRRVLLESGERQSCELRMQKEGADPFWARLDGATVQATGGKEIRLSLAITDITDQKRAECEALDSARQRDHFLAVLSHELRNPMAAIQNATSLIKKQGMSEETQLEAHGIIERHVRHVARLLDDLLDVSRITHGKFSIRRSVFDITKTMAEVVESVQPRVDERRQQLCTEIPNQPLMIDGDAGRLMQAQTNILVNASKFTGEEGTIRYSIARETNEAVITICDDGEGISSASIGQVFEPFNQSNQSRALSQDGMGLGLPLAKMLVEAHGGTIDVRSAGISCGSEFTIRLPLTKLRPEVEPPVETTMTSGNKMVIVEDNDGIRKMLAASMRLKGFDVTTAVDGGQGLEAIFDFDPNVALIDIGLPDLDGYGLAWLIREKPKFRHVLLVAVTGYGTQADRKKALRAGFDMHFVKPIDPDELFEMIVPRIVPDSDSVAVEMAAENL